MFLVLVRKTDHSRTIIPINQIKRIYENSGGWAIKTADSPAHIVVDPKVYCTPSLQENPFL